MLTSLFADVRYAIRIFRTNPGFSIAAVLAIGLGVGANTAMFGVINAVLLRSLPFAEPDRIVSIMRKYRAGPDRAVSVPHVLLWRDQPGVFSAAAAYDVLGGGYNLVVPGGPPERIQGYHVSASFFDVLGVKPLLGRAFIPGEDRIGGEKLAILSYGLWQRRFGSNSGILGAKLVSSGETFTVIGVMPPGIAFPYNAELWTPLQLPATSSEPASYLFAIGRLRPGITFARAQAQLDPVTKAIAPASEGEDKAGVALVALKEQLAGPWRSSLLLLLGMVSFVLLIACANVANLLLARSIVRSREMALRIALGAGRRRIVRQLLTEGVALSIFGSMLGLLLAAVTTQAITKWAPANLPRGTEINIDIRVLLFALLLAIVTGVIFSLAPALQAFRGARPDALKQGHNRVTAGGKHLRLTLVVAEFALAEALLFGAAMFSVSLVRTSAVDPGFQPSNVLTVKLWMSPANYKETLEVTNATHAMLERITALPGIRSAATITSLPLEAGPDLPFVREGQPGDSDTSAKYRIVSPGYFGVVRVGLRAGRFFTDMDRENTTPVIIISEAMARQYWPNQDPIGQRITIGKDMGPQFTDRQRLVVGVVGSIREDGLDRSAPPAMFIPDRQAPNPLMALLVRNLPLAVVIKTEVPPQRLIRAVQQAIWSVDPQQPLWQVRTMEQVMNAWMAPRKFQVFAVCAFAGLGLLLAGLGIYSMVSYVVSQRTRELGIRIAVGARSHEIALLVLRQALEPVLMGVLLGLILTLLLSRGLAAFCYGVAASDPIILASISLILILIAMAAVILPARRAITIDPVLALRHE